MVVGFTVLPVTSLLSGLFPPSNDQNYSPDSALSGGIFRYIRGQADGPPEAIVSQIPPNIILYSSLCHPLAVDNATMLLVYLI